VEGLPAVASADAVYPTVERTLILRYGYPVVDLVSIILVRNCGYVPGPVCRAIDHLYAGDAETTSEWIDMVAAVAGCLLLWIYMHQWVFRAVQKRRKVEIIDVVV